MTPHAASRDCVFRRPPAIKQDGTLVAGVPIPYSAGDPDPYPDPDWIRIQWVPWIRILIRIKEGKNYPQKSEEISFFEVLDVLF